MCEHKIVNIFLSINFNIIVLGAQKNHLNEKVLLSTQYYPQYMFWLRIFFLLMMPLLTNGRVAELCPWARHFIRCFVLVQRRKTENCPNMTKKLLTGIKASKQFNNEALLLRNLRGYKILKRSTYKVRRLFYLSVTSHINCIAARCLINIGMCL